MLQTSNQMWWGRLNSKNQHNERLLTSSALSPRSIMKRIDNQPNKNKSYRPEMMFINIFVLVLVCVAIALKHFLIQKSFLVHKSLHRFWPNQQIIVKFKCLRSMVSLYRSLGLVSSTQWRRQNNSRREGTRESSVTANITNE